MKPEYLLSKPERSLVWQAAAEMQFIGNKLWRSLSDDDKRASRRYFEMASRLRSLVVRRAPK